MGDVIFVTDSPFNSSLDIYEDRAPTNLNDTKTGIEKQSSRDSAQSGRSNSLPPATNRSDSYVRTRCQYAVDTTKGFLVRLCLVIGNCLAAWRAVVMTGDDWQWLLTAICMVLLLLEFLYVAKKRHGREWKWWSPCFLVYLATTLPLVWRIQLYQQEQYVQDVDAARKGILTAISNSSDEAMGPCSSNGTINSTDSTGVQPETTTQLTRLDEIGIDTILYLSDETWVICMNESIIYLIIIGRWFLPRGAVSREFLADLLLEFLAIASDVMELLAIFDIGLIRGNRNLNYVILTIWSVSFVQFLPMLTHKRKYKPIASAHLKCITRPCGTHFTEIISTLMSIILQDGPFLVIRLYIMVELNIITYSLTFFMLKNICTLLLLLYRLLILCRKAPCCNR